MRPTSLFEALCQLVPWQRRRPATRDATLWHDAEFQILLGELRYRPTRRLYDSSAERRVLSGSRRHRNPELG